MLLLGSNHFLMKNLEVILRADKFLKCDWLRPVVFKFEISLLCSINRKQHRFFGVFRINTGSWYFKTPQISRAAAAARDILVNFEISLAVFIPNTPRNRVISYTNHEISSAIERFSNDFLKFINNSCRENKGSQYREGGLDMWSLLS